MTARILAAVAWPVQPIMRRVARDLEAFCGARWYHVAAIPLSAYVVMVAFTATGWSGGLLIACAAVYLVQYVLHLTEPPSEVVEGDDTGPVSMSYDWAFAGVWFWFAVFFVAVGSWTAATWRLFVLASFFGALAVGRDGAGGSGHRSWLARKVDAFKPASLQTAATD